MKRTLRKSGSRKRHSLRPVIVLFAFFALLLSLVNVYAQEEGRDGAPSLYRESIELFDNGDVRNAIEKMNAAIKAAPEYAEAYDKLGYMLMSTGEYDSALSAFQSALTKNPGMRTSKYGIGFALLEKGDLKGAESKFTDALTLNPYPSMAHYGLGLVYERLEEYEKAVKHFKEGIRKDKSK